MSWGEGKCWDYGYKCREQIGKRTLSKEEKRVFLDKKWQYVSRHANLDKDNFILSMLHILGWADYRESEEAACVMSCDYNRQHRKIS